MSFFLNNIQDINKKSFCFNDIDDYDNSINYNYYNYGINKPKKRMESILDRPKFITECSSESKRQITNPKIKKKGANHLERIRC